MRSARIPYSFDVSRIESTTITLEETNYVAFSGRVAIVFTPVLKPDFCAYGCLRFKSETVWKDQKQTHATAKNKALENAIKTMEVFAQVLRKQKDKGKI